MLWYSDIDPHEFNGPKNAKKHAQNDNTGPTSLITSVCGVHVSVIFAPNSHSATFMTQLETWFMGPFSLNAWLFNSCVHKSIYINMLCAARKGVGTGLRLSHHIRCSLRRTVRSEIIRIYSHLVHFCPSCTAFSTPFYPRIDYSPSATNSTFRPSFPTDSPVF